MLAWMWSLVIFLNEGCRNDCIAFGANFYQFVSKQQADGYKCLVHLEIGRRHQADAHLVNAPLPRYSVGTLNGNIVLATYLCYDAQTDSWQYSLSNFYYSDTILKEYSNLSIPRPKHRPANQCEYQRRQ
jgi:hypothetical protein